MENSSPAGSTTKAAWVCNCAKKKS